MLYRSACTGARAEGRDGKAGAAEGLQEIKVVQCCGRPRVRERDAAELRSPSYVPSVKVWSTNCIAWSLVIVLSVETFSLLKTTPYALSQVAMSSGRKAG
jgi:hypothetical protein